MKFLFMIAVLFGFGFASADTLTCSDSKGQIAYELQTFGYGVPPQPGEHRVRSTETWTFQGKELSKVTEIDNSAPTKTGVNVTANFDMSTKKILKDEPGLTRRQTYAVELSFSAFFEPPFNTKEFVICDSVVRPPAP